VLRIAICDDEQSAITTIRGYLDKLQAGHYPEIVYDCYTSGESLLAQYDSIGMEEYYDMILMDIEMGEINGLSTVEQLKEINNNPLVIYITKHTEFVYDAYETAPYRYLLKPIDFEEFEKVFKKAVVKIEGKGNTFTFKNYYDEVRLYLEEIYYFESQLYKVKVSTKKGDYIFSGALKDVCKELQGKGFALAHNSYLINLAHVFMLQNDTVVLQNGSNIPVAQRKNNELKEAYADFKYRRSGV